MARPPRRSDNGRQRRQPRRHLYILANHNGDQGVSIYKLNEDGFDSDDAFSEDSGSISSDDSEDSGSISSDDSEDSGSISSDDSEDSGSMTSEDSEDSGFSSPGSTTPVSSKDSEYYFEAQDRYDSEYDADSRARRLRHRRLVVRLGTQAGCPDFVAAGTTTVNFLLDTATRLVSDIPPYHSPKKSAAFWTVGGSVYAMDLAADKIQCLKERCLFERLGPEPQRRHYGNWRWEALPPPPFTPQEHCRLQSHAVHPGGAAVFLSFYGTGTFSFDSERLEWARHRGWVLPFHGEACYVRVLDAWVGLCARHRGRLAACQVVDGRRDGGAEPASKCGKDLQFRHRWKRHAGASLVYMGDAKLSR